MRRKIIQVSFSMNPSNFNDALSSPHEYFFVEPFYCERLGFHGDERQNCILLECEKRVVW